MLSLRLMTKGLCCAAVLVSAARPRPPHTSVPAYTRLFAEILKLLNFSFFAKHFKLYGQLTERKREGREGTAFQ